ncbi:hypothetical protein F4780DRAFT_667991 [Xylariomycetidae sp. FL0641]|nr:hypothetical protein F4780DRAFT_667991 [Xylariomycetidae sp. FL0641]
MEEKAKVFCTGSDSPLKNINASWIEKFKQKHGFLPGKLTRRASETAIPDSTRLDRLERLDTESPLLSASQTPGGISPASPAGQLVSPRTSSTNLKGEGKEAGSGSGSGSGFAMFGESSYRHPHSQSTTSLSSAVTDPPSSTLSAGAFSPTSQFTFSPDPNTGLFNGLPGSSNFQRPRSQTVPNIEPLEYLNQSQGSEPLTPKYSTSGTAPSSALESPAHELPAPPFGLDSAISPPALHHASSNGSLAGRSTTSGAVSAMGSTPGSPTQEDARRAADTLLSFMQHQSSGWVDQNDYMIFVRLTEKLGIAQQQHGIPKVSSSSQGLGTLSRIPEGDTEMTNASPPLLRNAADMRA